MVNPVTDPVTIGTVLGSIVASVVVVIAAIKRFVPGPNGSSPRWHPENVQDFAELNSNISLILVANRETNEDMKSLLAKYDTVLVTQQENIVLQREFMGYMRGYFQGHPGV